MTNCNGGDNGSLLVLGLLMMHEEGGEWRLCSLSSRPSRRSTGNSTMNNLFLFAVVGVVLFAGATAQILDDGDDDVSVLQCPLGLFEHATGIQAVRDNLCTYRAQCQPVRCLILSSGISRQILYSRLIRFSFLFGNRSALRMTMTGR